MAKVLSSEEVTLDSINELLEMCYKTKLDRDDKDIYIKDLCIRIMFDSDREWLHLIAHTSLRPDAAKDKALQLVNDCNDDFIFLKVYLAELKDRMIIRYSYDIDYRHGLIPAALMRAVKTFNDIADNCMKKAEEAGLLESDK